MTKGILGKKIGMTQVFGENGELIPVTVVEVSGNVVMQKKTEETDGYNALQIGYGDKRDYLASARSNKYANRAEQGHAKKSGATPKRFVREFTDIDLDGLELGQEVPVDTFAAGDVVDVTGVSKGKGFQGNIKRHNHARGPMSHGSRFHRSTGSIGMAADPAKIQKGKAMPGRMGGEQVTLQNLEVVKVDVDNGVVLIKGNVPGPRKGFVKIQSATKRKEQ